MDQNIILIYYKMINDHEKEQLNGLLSVFNKKSTKKYKDDPVLKGKRRIFNQELLEKFDIPARKIIKEKLGDNVIDNPDEYQQDLIVTDKNCKYKFIEIQVISQWIYEKYPYNTLYLYERKAKYDDDTLFITLNRNFTAGYIFDRKSINGIKPRRLIKYHREFIYDVPWRQVINFQVEDLNWDMINLY